LCEAFNQIPLSVVWPDFHSRLPRPVHLARHQQSLTAEQKAHSAEPFDAEGQFLIAGKKLLDTKDNAFRAATAVRTKITDYWRGLTLPSPELDVRLIKHD